MGVHILFIIILAKSSINIYSLFTRSLSSTISPISSSLIFSPIFDIAFLKSLTDIFPSWSESNTLRASIKSCKVSLSLPRAYTTSSRIYRPNMPVLFLSTFAFISLISVSVGFKLRALTSVPNSEVATWPLLLLSNRLNISLISFDESCPAISNEWMCQYGCEWDRMIERYLMIDDTEWLFNLLDIVFYQFLLY